MSRSAFNGGRWRTTICWATGFRRVIRSSRSGSAAASNSRPARQARSRLAKHPQVVAVPDAIDPRGVRQTKSHFDYRLFDELDRRVMDELSRDHQVMEPVGAGAPE